MVSLVVVCRMGKIKTKHEFWFHLEFCPHQLGDVWQASLKPFGSQISHAKKKKEIKMPSPTSHTKFYLFTWQKFLRCQRRDKYKLIIKRSLAFCGFCINRLIKTQFSKMCRTGQQMQNISITTTIIIIVIISLSSTPDGKSSLISLPSICLHLVSKFSSFEKTCI